MTKKLNLKLLFMVPPVKRNRQPKRQRIGQWLGGDNAHQAVEVRADNKQR